METGHTALGAQAGMASLLARVARQAPRVAAIVARLGLCDEEVVIVLMALAPEVDLRYERLFGYLQDDIGKKRPGIDLIARLFCADLDERLQWLRMFEANAPLMRHHVLEAEGVTNASLASRTLALDPQWRNYLLGLDELDPRLARVATLTQAGTRGLRDTAVDGHVLAHLQRHVVAAAVGEGDVRVILTGPHGVGKCAIASAIANELSLRLLTIDLRSFKSSAELAATFAGAARACHMLRALLYVHGVCEPAAHEPQLLRALHRALATTDAWFCLSLTEPLPPMHVDALRALRLTVAFPTPSIRLAAWSRALRANEINASADDLSTLSDRFKLGAAQIEQAATDVRVRLDLEDRENCTLGDLTAAARALCGGELAHLAERVCPEHGFDALVASADVMEQLREVCDRAENQARVRRQWAPGSVHVRTSGFSVLFSGPSGTGKTLAAEALAYELGFDLFRVDLSVVVSKYIGETEKNLDRVFSAAEAANAVLFFDEADALFGKRSEVKDARDRYANIEVSYLLQKIEQFDGVAVLASNFRQNLDAAFARRLAFCLNFAFPEEADRARLWEALWPAHAPRARDVDLTWFAREFALAGGNIRNAIVAAAHLAMAQNLPVGHAHLLHATRREYQKLGKSLNVTVRSVEPARAAVA